MKQSALFIKKSFFIFISILLVGFIFIMYEPSSSWDRIPYMFLAQKISVNPEKDTTIYDDTYQILFENNKKISQTDKKIVVEEKQFLNLLPYYKVKPLYILLVKFCNVIGFNLYTSSYLVSLLSILFFAFFVIVKSNSENIYTNSGFIFSIFLTQNMRELALFSTPDALTFLLLFVFYYHFIFNTNSNKALFFIGFLAILTRPDNVIFVSAVYILYAIINKNYYYLYPLIVNLVLYKLIYFLAGNPSWSRLFMMTLCSDQGDKNLTLTIYFQKIKESLYLLVPLISIVILYINLWLIKYNLKNRKTIIALSILVTLIIRYILFPVVWNRFNLIFIVILAFNVITSITSDFRNKNQYTN